jgi:hypothetical protein
LVGKIETKVTGDRKRPQIGERPRQVAQSFPKIEGRRQCCEIGRAKRLNPAGMRPSHVEPHEADCFVRPVDEELVLRAGLERAEPGDRRQARRFKALPLIADRHVCIRRDALRQIEFDVSLSRAVGPGRVDGNLRHRHLVGDEWIVGEDRGRKETLSGEAVRKRAARRQRRQCGRERKPRSAIGVRKKHGDFPKSVEQGSERAAPGSIPRPSTLTDQAMMALCAYGWGAGCKGAGGARRDNNGVGRREKCDARDIERDHRTGGNAGDGRAGVAVPETAGCKIVMVFVRLSRRRGFACRAGRHPKT